MKNQHTPTRKELEAEEDANFAVFGEIPFKANDKGKFALLRKCELVEVVETHRDGRMLGAEKFPDGIFSIQEIMPDDFVEDLGFMGYVFR